MRRSTAMLLRLLAAIAVCLPVPAAAKGGGRLFESDAPVAFTLRGPINRLVGHREPGAPPLDATLSVEGSAPLPVRLSVRGITRRAEDICQFPPILIEFTAKPPADSPFAGQKKLKLATHCRREPAFGQHLLVEYGAYRMLNVVTPVSFRARLASVSYADGSGRPDGPHAGFLLEDEGALAHRAELEQQKIVQTPGARVPIPRLSPADGARTALFEWLIGNLDWAMTAGPAGSNCCHNMKLLGGAAGPTMVPVPYDFDFSGLVDAPYATPPEGMHMSNVRERRYRGYCAFNAAAPAAAAALAAKQAEMLAAFDATPGLDGAIRAKAHGYLAHAFETLAQPSAVQALLRGCIG